MRGTSLSLEFSTLIYGYVLSKLGRTCNSAVTGIVECSSSFLSTLASSVYMIVIFMYTGVSW